MIKRAVKTVFFKYRRVYVIYEENGELFISSSKDYIDFFKKPKKIECSKNVVKILTSGKEIYTSVIPKGHILTYSSADKSEYSEIFAPKIAELSNSIKSKINSPKIIVSKYKWRKKFVAYCGEGSFNVMYSEDLKNWTKGEMEFSPRKRYFDKEFIKLGCVEKVGREIILFYYTKIKNVYSFGTMIFDKIYS